LFKASYIYESLLVPVVQLVPEVSLRNAVCILKYVQCVYVTFCIDF